MVYVRGRAYTSISTCMLIAKKCKQFLGALLRRGCLNRNEFGTMSETKVIIEKMAADPIMKSGRTVDWGTDRRP